VKDPRLKDWLWRQLVGFDNIDRVPFSRIPKSERRRKYQSPIEREWDRQDMEGKA
jgi:hypothetical protein